MCFVLIFLPVTNFLSYCTKRKNFLDIILFYIYNYGRTKHRFVNDKTASFCMKPERRLK